MSNDEGNIVTFGRMRPSKRLATNSFAINHLDKQIEFVIPKDSDSGYINNRKDRHSFSFSGGIFDANAKQHEVFERVALPIAKSVLEGYNATIFCYGQTGSGKTFTITGGPDDYNQRGLIPRTLSFLFSEIGQHKDWITKIYISYLELYNDKGYDLLDSNRDESRKLEDLPQVSMMDDMEGHLQFNGLSALPCVNEEEALNLLFLGDTNRVMCETPMNDASSRSHCIFTINVESTRVGSDVVRKSKMHLVDLAGSERGASFKIGSTKILTESKHINLSLHYLEMCITALHERSIHPERHTHVPYRNCMMTSVLKDSLGGNCKTAMIATMSGEVDNFNESISTCSFAGRVASIKNKAEINEEVDPKLIIRRLKQQIQEMKEELTVLRGEKIYRSGPLSAEEKERCMQLVQNFLATGNTAAKKGGEEDETGGLPVGDPKKLGEVFRIFRSMVLSGGSAGGASVPALTGTASSPASSESRSFALPPPDFTKSPDYQRLQQTISTQKQQIATQNHEINTLVCILRDREKAVKASNNSRPPSEAGLPHAATESEFSSTRSTPLHMQSLSSALPTLQQQQQHQMHQQIPMSQPQAQLSTAQMAAINSITSTKAGPAADEESVGPDHTRWLMERNAHFEDFKRSHRKNQVISENQEVLKQKYNTAKAWATEVNGARDHINALKERIAQLRVERAAQGLVDNNSGDDAEIESLMNEMQQYQTAYKEKFVALKGVKSEIEHLQHILEKSRKELQRDFEQWWSKRGGGAHAGEEDDLRSSQSTPATPQQSAFQPPVQPNFSSSYTPAAAPSKPASTPVPTPVQSQLSQSQLRPVGTPQGTQPQVGPHLMPSIVHLPPAQQAQMQQIFAACGYNPAAVEAYMAAAAQQQQMAMRMSTPTGSAPGNAPSAQQQQQLYQQQMAYYQQYAAAVAAQRQQTPQNIPQIGNPAADAEISKFYRMRSSTQNGL